MTFIAKYDGRCAGCQESISEGDRLEWDDGAVVHVTCYEDDTAPAPRPTCPECWLTITATGACGCDES